LKRRLTRAVLGEIRAGHLGLARARARLGDPRRLVDERRQGVDELATRAARALRASLARARTDLRALETRLFRAHPQRRIAEQRKTLQTLEHRLAAAVHGRAAQRRRLLDGLHGKLESLSPLAVLERGYSLARRPDGHVVTQASSLRAGDELHLRFRDGEVRTRVEDPEPTPGHEQSRAGDEPEASGK
jgi:exodeoxyribonuclease VII large subunit